MMHEALCSIKYILPTHGLKYSTCKFSKYSFDDCCQI
jgi:hypothetical protein